MRDQIIPRVQETGFTSRVEWCACGSPPRARGKEIVPTLSLTFGGIPPQMWGKAEVPVGAGLPSGLTPASAGKRQARSCRNREPRDHPRGYREKIRLQSISSRNTGSPPQVRGKEFCAGNIARLPRITPAGAGKSKKPH